MKKNVEDSKKYLKDNKMSKIPSWIKILLLKYWVAGAAFYFFGMGGSFIWERSTDEAMNTYNLIILLSLGYALFLEYIQKPIIRLMRTNIDDTYYYNLINLRGTKSFFLHLLYSFLLTLSSVSFVMMLDRHGIFFDPLNMTDGYEPLSLAFVYLVFDFICLFIKNSIIGIYKRIRYNIEIKRQQELLDENDVKIYSVEDSIKKNDNFLNDDNDNDTNKE